MSSILIIEDDTRMQTGLRDNLEYEGFKVRVEGEGTAGLRTLTEGEFDCVILDVMLPGLSGFEILKRAREKGVTTPVILLTAKGEEIDKVLGLELGADDYMTKPFSLRELLARVRALIRRGTAGAASGGGPVRLGNFEADVESYNATKNGEPVAMTSREFEVLGFLWRHRNRTVSRDQLLESVWGYDDSVSTRTVDNFILRLRKKIEDDPADPRFLVTIHGTGYKLIV